MRELFYELGRFSLQILALIGAVWCILFVDTCARDLTIEPELPEEKYRSWARAMDRRPKVRVLLKELDGNRSVTFQSTKPVEVYRGDRSGSTWQRLSGQNRIRIEHRDGLIWVNGTNAGNEPLHLVPVVGAVTHTGTRTYRGSFTVYPLADGGIRVVNRVPMNKYLWSVLGMEMDLTFPMEALRTQAVAARTFALWEMDFQDRDNPASRYDVRNTAGSQVYHGKRVEGPKSRKAVESTRGLILAFENRILHAYYHSTCGGTTEHAADAIGVEERPVPPPLQGGVPCPWDDVSPVHSWKQIVTSRRLRRNVEKINRPVRSMAVSARTTYQRAKTVNVTLAGGDTITLDANQLRYAFPGKDGIASNWYRIERIGNGRFRVRGKGWGHGAGLCQMGAVGAARDDIPFEDILSHYYPGTTIVFAYGKETTDQDGSLD